MAKLISKYEECSFNSYREHWGFSNGLNAYIAYGARCEMCIKSSTGDVSDQIYARLKLMELFKDVKLIVSATYCLGFDKCLVQEIIDYVETVDVNTLKTGKSY